MLVISGNIVKDVVAYFHLAVSASRPSHGSGSPLLLGKLCSLADLEGAIKMTGDWTNK